MFHFTDASKHSFDIIYNGLLSCCLFLDFFPKNHTTFFRIQTLKKFDVYHAKSPQTLWLSKTIDNIKGCIIMQL